LKIMKSTKIRIATYCMAIATASLLTVGCAQMTKTQKGAVIGSTTGGTIGALIGRKAGNTAVGAVIGGAIGGVAGAYIGRKMDRQAEEIRKNVPGAEVIDAGEGLIVKFDSGILFDVNKSELKANAKTNIENLAATMKNNPETNIMVIGHTDADGSDSYNYSLSERRAAAVKAYTASHGVSNSRLTTVGKGETEPIADNSSANGKAQNRRVEIVIVANETLKNEARQNAQ
jgi:outer membrane protein OmpA-like peptidoglycan-associated protein